MTLLEVMTAAAVAAIAMTVSASVFTSLIRMRRESARLVEVQSAGAVAMTELQSQLVNAGYRFPAPAFAVNIRNNVTTLPPGGPGTSDVITATTGCGTGGLAAGSDSIELVTGRTDLYPGKVAAVDTLPSMSPTTDHNVVLESFMPFFTTENGAGVVMFADATGDSCMGRVYSGPAGSSPPNINVTMIDRDWNDVTSAATTYPNCPRAGMTVYRFAQRQRYFVCNEPNAADGGIGGTSLYRQDALADPVGFTYENQPRQKIQDGIEDLQVAARVYARIPAMSGQDCTPAVGGGEGFCFCDFSSSSACQLGADPNAPRVNKSAWVSWVSGLRVSLDTIGARPMVSEAQDAGRPTVMDHTASNTYDGFRRLTLDTSLPLTNVVQVVP